MTDTTPTDVKVARELTAIVELYAQLGDQAIHRSSDHEFPGGDALVMLGPAANRMAYESQILSTILGRTDGPAGEYDYDSDPAPPLLVLAGWSDIIRELRDQETSLKATIQREADYIRASLDWCCGDNSDGEPNFIQVDEMLTDLRRCRLRMEAVLLAGIRPEMGVPCMYDECGGSRLRRAILDDGSRTDWQCPKCRRTWSDEDYWRNVAAANGRLKVEQIDGTMWCTVDWAARDVGRPQATIRKWIHEGGIGTACMILGRRQRFVSLDDVRERDQVATRGRGGYRLGSMA